MRLILDTNIVLDWLVFNDPATQALQLAVTSHRVEVLVQALVLDELVRVLAYPNLKLSVEKQALLFAQYRGYASGLELPQLTRDNLLQPAGFPLCRDKDDQPFIALAYHANAVLVSKDKAVLKLRKRAKRFDIKIATLNDLNAMLAETASP